MGQPPDAQKYSDESRDVFGRTASGKPKIKVESPAYDSLHIELAGSNPLVLGAPDIDTKLDIADLITSQQGCYAGHLYGDAFPNTEVFVVNSQKQPMMLIAFATDADRNIGPVSLLPGNNNREMGMFSDKCGGK